MRYVGFTKLNNGTYTEHLPYNEQLTSSTQKRAIFFNMFNTYMDKDLAFTKAQIAVPCSMEETFKHKIMSEIDISCVRTHRSDASKNICLDMVSTQLIHAYFMQRPMAFPLKKRPFMRVGKLISLIYSPQGLSLMLDLEDMFLHLVYERIKKVNRYAEVQLLEKSILIQDKRVGVEDSLIIPSYRKLDKEKLHFDNDFILQMSSVEKTINAGEVTQVYLVYPKHPNFKKHINIKLPYQTKLLEDEYKVKVMPYSFSFCEKKLRRKPKVKQQAAA